MSDPQRDEPILVDSHAHLDRAFYSDSLETVVAESVRELAAVVAIGAAGDPRSARAAVALAERHPTVFATVGVHPHEARKWGADIADELAALARHQRVVAVGEIGLDYYYDRSPREEQRAVFREQIRLAHAVGKPLVLHIRDAWDDALPILEEERAEALGGVVHCFTGGATEAEAVLASGFSIGVTGIATYSHAANLRAVLRSLPLDRLLVETDSPFLTPLAARGVRPNRPTLVRHVAEALAELRGESFEALARATADNARRLFRFDEAGSAR